MQVPEAAAVIQGTGLSTAAPGFGGVNVVGGVVGGAVGAEKSDRAPNGARYGRA